MPPCADDVMIGICCPDGESGLVLAKLGERPVAAAAAARLFLDWRAGNLVGFVLSSPLLRLVKAHNLLTFTIYSQFTVEELC